MVSEQIANLPYVSKRILGSSPSHSAKLSSKASTYLLLTFISLSAINNISCGCDVMVDIAALDTAAERRGGSSPFIRTKK